MSVLVLMSVFNGEEYISEQLDSILKQKINDVDILIRDDGSDDTSINIINNYIKKNKNISLYTGENIGSWKSFMDLIYSADNNYDYYAFSDQDDVWLPDKLGVAVEMLEQMSRDCGKDIPLMYGGNVCPVNKKLEKIDTGINLTGYSPTFGNSMIQGITSGLTCVFNNAALKKVRTCHPEYMIMHDWWLYMTVTCYGRVVYDDDAYVLYRQHEKNVCGARVSRLERIKYRLKHFNERKCNVPMQVSEFLKCYEDIPDHNRRLAELLCDSRYSFLKRIELVFNKEIKRQKVLDNIVYKILVLFGYL